MRILIAEDDRGMAKLLSYVLQRCGHTVEVHWDGETAMKSISDRVPDLVIVDLVLPNIDGLQILAFLQNNPQTRNVPAMMVTSTRDRDVVQRCRELGVVDFIVKPFKPALLRQRVQRVARMRA